MDTSLNFIQFHTTRNYSSLDFFKYLKIEKNIFLFTGSTKTGSKPGLACEMYPSDPWHRILGIRKAETLFTMSSDLEQCQTHSNCLEIYLKTP